MINDVEMLTYVLQNAEMGCQGITCIRKCVPNSNVDNVLCEQLVRYGKLYHCAATMLKNRGAEVRTVGPVVKAMTKHAAYRDIKRDNSSSHIAEMMIKGSTMGVNKMSRHIREYDGSDRNIETLAKRMLETEREHIKSFENYL